MRQISGDSAAPEAQDTPSAPLDRATSPTGPSAELLERALDGWERFLDGFEGASGE
ncbi:hypothetical protein GCM10010302_11170 [Streptomyces polychromogenes]|uniref:Uncharacterized protein n=1 Tax=Streptomyces polychromogenes TaxID=67342 RepID=A0ABP3ETW9_9ACTN